MSQTIKFACLTGLRPGEVVESVKLINDRQAFPTYYNQDRQALEHFRYPDIFLRHTKKCYISFVSPEVLNILDNIGTVPSYNTMRLACRKRGLKLDMRYCRKVFASWLSNNSGIQSEVIDFLQGRVSTSVFSRHYLTPNASLTDKVLEAIAKLRREME
jgi:intergrase/recombinase